MKLKKIAAFTLIEIMVVLVIISLIVTAAAIYSINTSTIEAKQTAKKIYSLLGLAQQEAILRPSVLAFTLNSNGYNFIRYQVNNNNLQGSWKVINNDPFLHFYYLPRNVTVELTMLQSNTNQNNLSKLNNNDLSDNDQEKIPSMIIFSNNGDITPFVVTISPSQKKAVYKIIGYENGEMRLVNMQ